MRRIEKLNRARTNYCTPTRHFTQHFEPNPTTAFSRERSNVIVMPWRHLFDVFSRWIKIDG